jgi:hypothetical protein
MRLDRQKRIRKGNIRRENGLNNRVQREAIRDWLGLALLYWRLPVSFEVVDEGLP